MTCSRLAAIAFQTQTQTCRGLSHSKKKLLLFFFFIKSGNMGDVKRNRSWLFCEFHSFFVRVNRWPGGSSCQKDQISGVDHRSSVLDLIAVSCGGGCWCPEN